MEVERGEKGVIVTRQRVFGDKLDHRFEINLPVAEKSYLFEVENDQTDISLPTPLQHTNGLSSYLSIR